MQKKKEAEFLVDNAYRLYLAAGLLLPLFMSGKREKVYGLRACETLGLSVPVVEALKKSTNERRPDSLQENSFPSSHTMNAFALATVAAAFHKKQAPFWYGAAALTGLSRVALRRHRVRDVVAGSLLGYGIARWELSCRRGWVLPNLMQSLQRRLVRSDTDTQEKSHP